MKIPVLKTEKVDSQSNRYRCNSHSSLSLPSLSLLPLCPLLSVTSLLSLSLLYPFPFLCTCLSSEVHNSFSSTGVVEVFLLLIVITVLGVLLGLVFFVIVLIALPPALLLLFLLLLFFSLSSSSFLPFFYPSMGSSLCVFSLLSLFIPSL